MPSSPSDAAAVPLTVFVAMPKGDRAEWLVEKCTEIGIDRIVAVTAERSVVRWSGSGPTAISSGCAASPGRRRCNRVVCACPRSSGRGRPSTCWPTRVVAEPGGRPIAADRHVDRHRPGGWLVAGGARTRRGTRCPSDRNVLRVETAAVVAATLMVAHRVVLR